MLQLLFEEGSKSADPIQDLMLNDYDVALLPDCGMTWWSIMLVNTRWANVQICGYSHPASTLGGTHIDFWVSDANSLMLILSCLLPVD